MGREIKVKELLVFADVLIANRATYVKEKAKKGKHADVLALIVSKCKEKDIDKERKWQYTLDHLRTEYTAAVREIKVSGAATSQQTEVDIVAFLNGTKIIHVESIGSEQSPCPVF